MRTIPTTNAMTVMVVVIVRACSTASAARFFPDSLNAASFFFKRGHGFLVFELDGEPFFFGTFPFRGQALKELDRGGLKTPANPKR